MRRGQPSLAFITRVQRSSIGCALSWKVGLSWTKLEKGASDRNSRPGKGIHYRCCTLPSKKELQSQGSDQLRGFCDKCFSRPYNAARAVHIMLNFLPIMLFRNSSKYYLLCFTFNPLCLSLIPLCWSKMILINWNTETVTLYTCTCSPKSHINACCIEASVTLQCNLLTNLTVDIETSSLEGKIPVQMRQNLVWLI